MAPTSITGKSDTTAVQENTSGEKSSAAAHTVINTPELLENILLQLPMKDLLLSQRVNKQFKATIDGSSKLQQALFFRLAPNKGTCYGRKGTNSLVIGSRIHLQREKWDLEPKSFDIYIDNGIGPDLPRSSTNAFPKIAVVVRTVCLMSALTCFGLVTKACAIAVPLGLWAAPFVDCGQPPILVIAQNLISSPAL